MRPDPKRKQEIGHKHLLLLSKVYARKWLCIQTITFDIKHKYYDFSVKLFVRAFGRMTVCLIGLELGLIVSDAVAKYAKKLNHFN